MCNKVVFIHLNDMQYAMLIFIVKTKSNFMLLTIYRLPEYLTTRVGILIVATIYLQLIQNRYMF